MPSRRKIPSLLGIAVLLVGIAAGVYMVGQGQMFRLGASGEFAPRDVRISNISGNSFTVSWVTDRAAAGYIDWGDSTSLGRLAQQHDQSPKRLHTATIEGLSPGSTYYFSINSGGNIFDNNGVPWSVATGPDIPAPTSTALASGRVVDGSGAPAAGVLVFVNSGVSAQLSTTTSPNGTWTIPLSTARNKTLTGHAIFNENTVFEIFVQGGEKGVATAQAIPSRINPTPDIILGQSHDFLEGQEGSFSLPGASVDLPGESGSLEPGGLLLSDLPEASSETVTLDSIDEDGEVIFTTSPEFFGEAPPGTVITITIESDPITGQVQTSSSGLWRWSPPTNLPEGTHTITISWTDAQGFLRSLTRTFTVSAAEGPGFESTPSGTTSTSTQTGSPSPTPTPSPSPTPSPASSPTPSASPTVTPSPTPSPTRVSLPATDSAMPVAGSLTPTLFLASIGIGLFISGIVISRRGIY